MSLRSLLVDITPLRTSREFRWLYAGQVGGVISRQLLIVAVPYQVFVETRSSLLVGAIGLVQLLPLIVFSVIGGAAADAMGRRKVLVFAYLLLSVTSTGFAINTVGTVAVWPIFALIAVNAAASGMESPTRTSMIPALVKDRELTSAFALNQTLEQASQVIVPAVGGVLIAQVGVEAVYWIAAAANIFAATALLPLQEHRPAGASGRVRWQDITAGWRYLRRGTMIQQLLIIDLNAMVFGMPRALFPVLGLEVLGGGATAVGLLHAAPGAGALIGAVTTGWVSKVERQGRVVILAVLGWGISIAAFGLVRSLVVALVLLAAAGASDVVSNVFRNAVLQLAVPDAYRGRVTAFKSALASGGPQLGDAESGAVAEVTTPTFSVVSGGIASVLGTVLILKWSSRLWYQTATETAEERRREEELLAGGDDD